MVKKMKTELDNQSSELSKVPEFIVGFSTEKENVNAVVNSIFYEKDTGNRYRLLENNAWEYIDNIHK